MGWSLVPLLSFLQPFCSSGNSLLLCRNRYVFSAIININSFHLSFKQFIGLKFDAIFRLLWSFKIKDVLPFVLHKTVCPICRYSPSCPVILEWKLENSFNQHKLSSLASHLSVFSLFFLSLSLLHTDFKYCSLYISGLLFLSLGNKKFPPISSTCHRTLADWSNTDFCNTTILEAIQISVSLFGNAFGVVPSPPNITGIVLTFLFHIFLIPPLSFVSRPYSLHTTQCSYILPIQSCLRFCAISLHSLKRWLML